MSTKTVPGGIAAARACDVVMLTYNLQQQQERLVLDACHSLNRGALIKKALAGGHLERPDGDPVQANLDLVFSHPGATAAVIGTIDPDHLDKDVAAARRAVD
jgi:hypothetical protein